MNNVLSKEVIEKNKLVNVAYRYNWDDSGSDHYESLDGYPAYSKEYAEYAYEDCVKKYPDLKYGWFIAERNGVYWCAAGCNKPHGVADGWKIIKESI